MGLGVALGLMVGILPGLGGIAGLSLLLPFIYGMDPTSALAMMIGLVAVIPTSDTFPSVLMGIPGSTASQATVLDGFPLAKKGEAARALSARLLGLAVRRPVRRPRPDRRSCSSPARSFWLQFGRTLHALTIFGLSMVGRALRHQFGQGRSPLARSAWLLGTIGAAPATGEYRMAFDSLYLDRRHSARHRRRWPFSPSRKSSICCAANRPSPAEQPDSAPAGFRV